MRLSSTTQTPSSSAATASPPGRGRTCVPSGSAPESGGSPAGAGVGGTTTPSGPSPPARARSTSASASLWLSATSAPARHASAAATARSYPGSTSSERQCETLALLGERTGGRREPLALGKRPLEHGEAVAGDAKPVLQRLARVRRFAGRPLGNRALACEVGACAGLRIGALVEREPRRELGGLGLGGLAAHAQAVDGTAQSIERAG